MDADFYRTTCLKNLLFCSPSLKRGALYLWGKVFNSFPLPLTLSPFPLLGKVFYNAHDIPTDLESTLERNGLTKMKVLVELFRINGGKPGYYLANLRDKKYHYCGQDWASVKAKLRELGIGRDEPSYS